jgi:hypothetical protein
MDLTRLVVGVLVLVLVVIIDFDSTLIERKCIKNVPQLFHGFVGETAFFP